MKKDNRLVLVPLLLLLTMALCFCTRFLPDSLGGIPLKKVNFLSDLIDENKPLSMDSLRRQLALQESAADSIAIRDSLLRLAGADSLRVLKRDSLYHEMSAEQGADSLGTRIEDYSLGHTGLVRFFAALTNCNSMGRPVRVAFMGDSFIEGDILVSDFRSALQHQFGGHGVGFVPCTSEVAQFRATIDEHSDGWKTFSMLRDHKHNFTLSGLLFEPFGENATVRLRAVKRFPELRPFSSLKFLYSKNEASVMRLVCNGSKDTTETVLPATNKIVQYEKRGSFSSASFSFSQAKGLQALGFVMEDNQGVTVDNLSLRGNSGIVLQRLDVAHCKELNDIRPYDLIVLQYGLNVVSDSIFHYGWYERAMIKSIKRIQACFPESDILLVGVSDRSHEVNGVFETIPSVLALLHTQREIARHAGIPFWNLFGAMGGENSMVRYVSYNWASKDYTHISFRGGRAIANALLNAILNEKKFYDAADKLDR